MEDGISVIICCYNSSKRLQPTLEHLILQKNFSIGKWEVIIVDNASTDNTAQQATKIWDSFASAKPGLKIVYEVKPGLSAARIKGIEESKFRYVLFCDDDNWLGENYLEFAFDIMKAHPKIGALGGKGSPVFEDVEPPHFWENQYHVLAVGDQWRTEGDITEERGVLYGAGMVVNKEAFYDLVNNYQFRFQVSDRKGAALNSSGDHELCLALRSIGYRIYFSRKLTFRHYIPKQRTEIGYYKKLFLSFGKSDASLFPYSIDNANANSIKNDYRYICLRCCRNIVTTWLKLVFTGYYYRQDKYKYIDSLHSLYNNLGVLKTTAALRNSYKNVIRNNRVFQSHFKTPSFE